MTTKSAVTKTALTALAILAVGGVLAACGSSTKGQTSSTAAASRPVGNRAALATCLRKHGVQLPAGGAPGGAPPGAPGGGSGQTPPAGPPAGGPPGAGGGNPKFRAALKACGANLPARAPAFSRQRIQRYVACVRQHGYKLPNPNFSSTGPVLPAAIRSSKSFQKASRACQSLLASPQQ